MKYTANKVYKNNRVAVEYDKARFYSLKGRLTNSREMALIWKAISQTHLTPPATILDLPCGTARLSLFLAEKGFNVVGLDISASMIDQGMKKIKGTSLEHRIKFEIGDGESLSFPDAYFDLPICLRLFGHLPPDVRQNVLNELSRVSKSNVIITYYHKNSMQQLIRKRKRKNSGFPWYPVNIKQIDEELKEAGLKRIHTYFALPFISETIVILTKKA